MNTFAQIENQKPKFQWEDYEFTTGVRDGHFKFEVNKRPDNFVELVDNRLSRADWYLIAGFAVAAIFILKR